MFGFPAASPNNIQFFNPTDNWVTWLKPQGVAMVSLFLIGGGGGGGGGRGISAVDSGGGGSGGSSGVSRYIFPAWFLPDCLYVRVGNGGVGGTAGASGNGGAGGNGNNSYVALHPDTTAQNLFGISNAVAATGGGGGTGTAGGAAGAAATIATATSAVLGQWALGQNFIAGNIGIIGGDDAGAAGGDVTIGTGIPILPGAPGAGIGAGDSFKGGDISALANTPFILSPGGAAGATNPGGSGFWFRPWPMFYGGTGGGGQAAVTGGDAGGCDPTAYGAGGGGGAGGLTTGGKGGAGGPGLVVIGAW